MGEEPRVALVVSTPLCTGPDPPGQLGAGQASFEEPHGRMDAAAIAAFLEEQGFEVTILCNPSRNELLKGVSSFQALVASLTFKGPGLTQSAGSGASGNGCLALFYYTGPVISMNGEQYILSSDWQVDCSELPSASPEWTVQIAGCKLQYVLGSMDEAYAGIVVIDATVVQIGSRCLQGQVNEGAQIAALRKSVSNAAVPSANLLILQSLQPATPSARTPEALVQQRAHRLTPLLLKELRDPTHKSVLQAVLTTRLKFSPSSETVVLQVGEEGLFGSLNLASGSRAETIQLAKHLSAVCKPWLSLEQRKHAAEQLLHSIRRDDPSVVRRVDTLIDLGCIPLLVTVLREQPAVSRQLQVELQCCVCDIFAELAENLSYCELLALEGVTPLLLDLYLMKSADPDPRIAAAAWCALDKLLCGRGAKVSLIAHNGGTELVNQLHTLLVGPRLQTTLSDVAHTQYVANIMSVLGSVLFEDYYGRELAVKQATGTGKLHEVTAAVKRNKQRHKLDATPEGRLLLHATNTVTLALKYDWVSTGGRVLLPGLLGLVPKKHGLWFGAQLLGCFFVMLFSILMSAITQHRLMYLPYMLAVVAFLVPDPWTRLVSTAVRYGRNKQLAPTPGELHLMERLPGLPGPSTREQIAWPETPACSHTRGDSGGVAPWWEAAAAAAAPTDPERLHLSIDVGSPHQETPMRMVYSTGASPAALDRKKTMLEECLHRQSPDSRSSSFADIRIPLLAKSV